MKSSKIIAGGIILSLPLLAGCASGADEEPRTPEEQTTQAIESAMPKIEITDGQVPNVNGRSLFEAITALREAGLRYEVTGDGFESETDSQSTRDWTVTSQSPASGAEAKSKDVVEMTVERAD